MLISKLMKKSGTSRKLRNYFLCQLFSITASSFCITFSKFKPLNLEIKIRVPMSCSNFLKAWGAWPALELLDNSTVDIFFLVQEILQEIHHTAGGHWPEDLSGHENQQEPDLLYTPLTSRDGSHKDKFGESVEILSAAGSSHKPGFLILDF